MLVVIVFVMVAVVAIISNIGGSPIVASRIVPPRCGVVISAEVVSITVDVHAARRAREPHMRRGQWVTVVSNFARSPPSLQLLQSGIEHVSQPIAGEIEC